MPAAIFSAPLEVVDEIAGNGIDGAEDEIILSVSTIVNGVKKSEATEIASELERLGEDIKNAAFEVFMIGVTQKAMTVDEVKNAVEAVKVRAIRSVRSFRPFVSMRGPPVMPSAHIFASRVPSEAKPRKRTKVFFANRPLKTGPKLKLVNCMLELDQRSGGDRFVEMACINLRHGGRRVGRTTE